MNTRLIQMTNDNIGVVALDALMPLGTITRRFGVGGNNPIYTTVNSNVDTITINEEGYYDVVYNASVEATAAGTLGFALLANGTQLYEVTQTVTAGDTFMFTLPFTVRVYAKACNAPTNNPMNIQIQLTGGAITSGTSNIQIEKRV